MLGRWTRHGDGPPGQHAEFARPFLEAGFPAFIDKPFCVDRRRRWHCEIGAGQKTAACGRQFDQGTYTTS
jgi:hypothetical protein